MLINRLLTSQAVHSHKSFGTSPAKNSVVSKILFALTAIALSACSLEGGINGFESGNGKKRSGQNAATPAPAQFDFSKECGLTPEQLEDKSAVLVSGNYTSFPIIVEGTSMGTAFTVITQAKLTISSTSSAKNQNINVSLLGSASGATGIIGLIATPIVKSKAEKASSAASGASTGTGLQKKDWLKLTNGSNPQFATLLCAAGQTQTITRNMGGGSSTVTFAPTLIDGVSPLAPIARMRLEFGSGKSFTVTAAVQGGETVAGTVTVKEVAPTLAYKDSKVKADIAYEFINDFPGGAHTVGLPRRQVLFIDVTKKQIVAIINEDDTIDENTGKVRPAAVLVRDP